ncbi:hypothetical protein [Eastern grey kangaroopox virus]|uniref:Uncharacterized protein n=1 Tax=Eastern grey kangaroopox virus TaxID=2042482 RepID=A0A2C9DTA6_9POXV|nr:hypothetical protein KM541_gp143 [Eastern grey kangaroopox virus]ATI21239.1 hypothetical protein [Eastern grey kangaroopox virus]ATX75145.1 hypothetical protein EKPV-NSW-ORF159 [Eastern grey kangaroopox virus]
MPAEIQGGIGKSKEVGRLRCLRKCLRSDVFLCCSRILVMFCLSLLCLSVIYLTTEIDKSERRCCTCRGAVQYDGYCYLRAVCGQGMDRTESLCSYSSSSEACRAMNGSLPDPRDFRERALSDYLGSSPDNNFTQWDDRHLQTALSDTSLVSGYVCKVRCELFNLIRDGVPI